MGWKKFFLGEPMPDKNDPKYRERYEREVQAGRDFADKTGISWLAQRLQAWGQDHKVLFLALVFGFVILCFVINLVRMVSAYGHSGDARAVAVERVDSAMKHRQDDGRILEQYQQLQP